MSEAEKNEPDVEPEVEPEVEPDVEPEAEPDVEYNLGDFSSPKVMRKNGWEINVSRENNPKYSNWCGRKTWFGYSRGRSNGLIKTTFLGNGRATLDFGNCYHSGKVVVYLNGKEISRAKGYIRSKEIKFKYSKGDTLMIKEMNVAIIKLISLTLHEEE